MHGCPCNFVIKRRRERAVFSLYRSVAVFLRQIIVRLHVPVTAATPTKRVLTAIIAHVSAHTLAAVPPETRITIRRVCAASAHCAHILIVTASFPTTAARKIPRAVASGIYAYTALRRAFRPHTYGIASAITESVCRIILCQATASRTHRSVSAARIPSTAAATAFTKQQ